MKMYYTTRELSNHAEELWFLRALGDEIIDNGSGPNDHGSAFVWARQLPMLAGYH
jgi:hypothetical protein